MINPPKTLKEAKKETYGTIYKQRYKEEDCAYSVYAKGRGIHNHQCSKKPGHGPAGLYCKQHANKVEGVEVKTKKKDPLSLINIINYSKEIKRLKILVKKAFEEGRELSDVMSKKSAWKYSDTKANIDRRK